MKSKVGALNGQKRRDKVNTVKNAYWAELPFFKGFSKKMDRQNARRTIFLTCHEVLYLIVLNLVCTVCVE